MLTVFLQKFTGSENRIEPNQEEEKQSLLDTRLKAHDNSTSASSDDGKEQKDNKNKDNHHRNTKTVHNRTQLESGT